MNNAGLNTRGYYKDLSLQDEFEMVVVNTYSYVLMEEFFLKDLEKRKTKSAYIMVSSGIIKSPAPYDGVYSATKHFERVIFEDKV